MGNCCSPDDNSVAVAGAQANKPKDQGMPSSSSASENLAPAADMAAADRASEAKIEPEPPKEPEIKQKDLKAPDMHHKDVFQRFELELPFCRTDISIFEQSV